MRGIQLFVGVSVFLMISVNRASCRKSVTKKDQSRFRKLPKSVTELSGGWGCGLRFAVCGLRFVKCVFDTLIVL